MPIRLEAPLNREKVSQLQAGDQVLLSGAIYTARDAAHQRICRQVEAGEPPAFPLKDQVIYYVGPTPAPPGKPIGSSGPTTSGRMDAFTPLLLKMGVGGMIGKGDRSQAVIEAMVAHQAVYFAAVGGLGALMAQCILASEVIAFPDLGTEAVRRLQVADFPLRVAVDSRGNNLYQLGPEQYRQRLWANKNKDRRDST